MKLFAKCLILMIVFSYICCTCSSSASITSVLERIDENTINFTDPNASPSECQNREFSEIEKKVGYVKCCYMESDCDFSDDKQTIINKYKGCTPFLEASLRQESLSIYNQICKTFKVSCASSSYLRMSLILLIIILL